MNQYFKLDPWCIIEESFTPENNKISEGIFSLGNGHMGQRANFEETYSGYTLQGSYMAGIYYPDKTKVGWWKNGYPEYFAKVLNSTNWIGITIKIDNEILDLAKCSIKEFNRFLNMKEGYLERTFIATLENGKSIQVNAKRFLSIVSPEIGSIKYSVTPLNGASKITLTPFLDGDIINEDSNYDEKFWISISEEATEGSASLLMKTKKLNFHVCSSMKYEVFKNNILQTIPCEIITSEKYVANTCSIVCSTNETVTLYKYVANTTSRDYDKTNLMNISKEKVFQACEKGFDELLKEHILAWDRKWKESDITIEGDVAAQQAIRFNIFQLNQTYTGKDPRLNIGPKGFTGEKYGGSTYWDTEAYCLPFYLSTADEKIAKNLLIYRYSQLDKAIENAKKLGFNNGAALYPMVTMNGEECHNEWEITFEEIHRNGAIAYAIYNYVNYTGDKSYLYQYGLSVLIGISRFWSERVNFSEEKQKYVILGVTGPNEYDNNVNNNWYTNKIACWTMNYTIDVINYLKLNETEKYDELKSKLNFDEKNEVSTWSHIIKNMYYPYNDKLDIFMQQDGYMDKEQILAKNLNSCDKPINQKWSWDRILRSCLIKQADVLQGMYFFENEYDVDTIKRHFEFYEPRTVHESSLSPCVHSIIAAKIGDFEKAYEMYLRTARLDLDNYNNDTQDGCHITSMAGTWLSIVQGFGGMRVIKGNLYFNPFIPKHWKSFSFKIMFRGILLKIYVTSKSIQISNESDKDLSLIVFNKKYISKANTVETIINYKPTIC